MKIKWWNWGIKVFTASYWQSCGVKSVISYCELLHLTYHSWWLTNEKAIASVTRDYWEKINATHWNQVNFMVVIISTISEKSFVSKWWWLWLRWTWTGCLSTQNQPQGLLNVRHQMNYQEAYALHGQEVIPLCQSNPIAHVCIGGNIKKKK